MGLFCQEPWFSVRVWPSAAVPVIVGADTTAGTGSGAAGTVIVIESVAGGVPVSPVAVSVTV